LTDLDGVRYGFLLSAAAKMDVDDTVVEKLRGLWGTCRRSPDQDKKHRQERK
jgi:hypothetical protein